MLHGTGAWIDDLRISGVLDGASRRYRVVAVDRPGFGYSPRPGGRVWSAATQADLVNTAMRRIGVDRYLVLGHSWGALVALECAIRHPRNVAGLVLAAGYLLPRLRLDAPLFALAGVPVVGTVFRHTVMPVIARIAWPLIMRRMFGPAPTSPVLSRAARGMAIRPAQLRAAAAESSLMFSSALRAATRLTRIRVPVGIVAGAGDAHVPTSRHSESLHSLLPGSLLHIVPGAGHMVHHTAPGAILDMVDRVADMAGVANTVE
jgi:pimeloyl-ACP methyl ester carboxylesterase